MSQFLKHNKDILLIRADKGNITVVIESERYNNQMNELLNDRYTYAIQEKNPMKRLESVVNDMAKR